MRESTEAVNDLTVAGKLFGQTGMVLEGKNGGRNPEIREVKVGCEGKRFSSTLAVSLDIGQVTLNNSLAKIYRQQIATAATETHR
jgi:hypothetical protein